MPDVIPNENTSTPINPVATSPNPRQPNAVKVLPTNIINRNTALTEVCIALPLNRRLQVTLVFTEPVISDPLSLSL